MHLFQLTYCELLVILTDTHIPELQALDKTLVILEAQVGGDAWVGGRIGRGQVCNRRRLRPSEAEGEKEQTQPG